MNDDIEQQIEDCRNILTKLSSSCERASLIISGDLDWEDKFRVLVQEARYLYNKTSLNTLGITFKSVTADCFAIQECFRSSYQRYQQRLTLLSDQLVDQKLPLSNDEIRVLLADREKTTILKGPVLSRVLSTLEKSLKHE